MLIANEIKSTARFVGEAKAIELIAKAGFDAWDYTMGSMAVVDWDADTACAADHPLNKPNYLSYVRELKQIGLDNGIRCNQSHAPFPVHIPQIRDMLKRCIECTAEAGGSICVIHPNVYISTEENARMFRELLPFAKEHGVKIATENMWDWDKALDQAAPTSCSDPVSFNAHLDAVDDEYFVACLDIGHAEMQGLNTSAPELILALGSHLQSLHIHDNNHLKDQHKLPFTGSINFDAVIAALAKIRYSGYLTLESMGHMHGYTAENFLQGRTEMAAAAKKLAAMYESHL